MTGGGDSRFEYAACPGVSLHPADLSITRLGGWWLRGRCLLGEKKFDPFQSPAANTNAAGVVGRACPLGLDLNTCKIISHAPKLRDGQFQTCDLVRRCGLEDNFNVFLAPRLHAEVQAHRVAKSS